MTTLPSLPPRTFGYLSTQREAPSDAAKRSGTSSRVPTSHHITTRHTKRPSSTPPAAHPNNTTQGASMDQPTDTGSATRTGSTTSTMSPAKRPAQNAAIRPQGKRPTRSTNRRGSHKSTSTTPINTRQIRNDRLGTLVSELTAALDKATSWEDFVTTFRGRSYLSPDVSDIDHPARDLLAQWKDHGVPVNTSLQPWTTEQKDESIQRGCHPSANEHSEFLREEVSEFIENRYVKMKPSIEVCE